MYVPHFLCERLAVESNLTAVRLNDIQHGANCRRFTSAIVDQASQTIRRALLPAKRHPLQQRYRTLFLRLVTFSISYLF